MQPNTEKENMKIFYKQTNEAQEQQIGNYMWMNILTNFKVASKAANMTL